MTTPRIIADHYLASAHATRDHARFGSPEDLHKALDQFQAAGEALRALRDVDTRTLATLQSLRAAAARGDYATAQAHHATITA